jgi:quinol monooxygenase YgiN
MNWQEPAGITAPMVRPVPKRFGVETEAVAAILQRFMPQAQQEPGVRAFMIHQSKSEPSEFFFYEVFENEDAFAAHQQTPHFKALIAGEALPKLVKRERAQYAPL